MVPHTQSRSSLLAVLLLWLVVCVGGHTVEASIEHYKKNAANNRNATRFLIEGTEYVRVIIGYNKGNGTTNDFSLRGSSETMGFDGTPFQSDFRRTSAVVRTIPVSEFQALQSNPGVNYVEEDSIVHMQQASQTITARGDPIASEVIPWGIKAVQGHLDGYIPLPPPMSSTQNKCTMTVCIVDAGVKLSHPDLPFKYYGTNVRGANFGVPSDQPWYNSRADHGTHVTGILFAQGGNKIGVRGVVSNTQGMCMLVARVFDDAFGSSASSEIDRAIEWCADNGANIINLSLGSSSQSSNQKALVTSLYEEENILLVAAAGNHGSTSNMYPASYSSVISVGSIDEDLSRSSFSNYNSNIDLVAPGNMILSLTTGTTIVLINGAGQRMTARIMQFSSRLSTSGLYGSTVSCGLGLSTCANARGKICVVQRGQVTFNTKAKNCQLGGGIGLILYNNVEGSLQGTLVSNGGVTIPCVTVSLDASTFVQQSLFMNMKTLDYNYGELSGTSMAAPHITGVIAKVWSARPRCTNKQVRAAVEHTARYLGQQNEYGRGLAQAVDAYRYLLNQPFPCGTGGGTTSAFDYDTHEADVDITIGQFSESQAQSAGGGRRRVSEETNRTAVSEDTEPVFL